MLSCPTIRLVSRANAVPPRGLRGQVRRCISATAVLLVVLLPCCVASGQVGCPHNPARVACISKCTQTGSECWELKNGNPKFYTTCLSQRESKCPADFPSQPTVAPYDLTWYTVDLNGLPLNPRWAQQDRPQCPGLPSIGACGSGGEPWQAPCTTQSPQEVPLPSVFNLQHPGSGFCTTSGANGHHENWAVVSYTGGAEWESHSPVGYDDDYNINIERPDQSAYTDDNPKAVLTEFDSDETIDHFVTPWWQAFHDAVNRSDAAVTTQVHCKNLGVLAPPERKTDFQAIIQAPNDMLTVNGKPAEMVQVGMMGLDCAHYCGSEIHPVLALALHVKDDPADDTWAIFARNAGDEGFCAIGSITDRDLTTIFLSLPWRPGAAIKPPVVLEATSWKRAVKGGTSTENIKVTTFPLFSGVHPTNFVVEIDLGDSSREPLVHGELHLQWTMPEKMEMKPLISASIAPGTIAPSTGLIQATVATSSSASATPEPEEQFEQFVSGLPADVRAKIAAALPRSPSPTWVDFKSTNLSQTPSGFQPHPARYSTAGKAALTGVTIAPDQPKVDYYQKLDTILSTAKAPPAAQP